LGALGFILNLIVVALFSNGKGNRQTIAPRRKRTSGERRVRAGRIFEVIEIEDELARFVETICGKAGVEKTASGVCGCGAGSVTKDEEKFWLGWVFEDGLETISFAGESEFGGAGHRLVVTGADESGQSDCLRRLVWQPF